MKEFDLIERLLRPLAIEGAPAFGLSDDAAVLSPPEGQQLVFTKDVMVSGVHFPTNESPDLIARKLLRVNLSDLAAMGAKPLGYMLGLIGGKIDGHLDAAWMKAFVSGLAADQEEFGTALLGGDTVSGSETLALSLTAIGLVPKGAALMRGGAAPGDGIFVTGTIGDGALGLKSVLGDIAADPYLVDRYRVPQPRLSTGVALRGIASACIDISDGLIADAGHIAEVSACNLSISRDEIPLSDAARSLVDGDASHWAVICAGGDDYELVFTVPPDRQDRLGDIADATGVAIKRIGEVLSGTGVELIDKDGRVLELPTVGFEHKF